MLFSVDITDRSVLRYQTIQVPQILAFQNFWTLPKVRFQKCNSFLNLLKFENFFCKRYRSDSLVDSCDILTKCLSDFESIVSVHCSSMNMKYTQLPKNKLLILSKNSEIFNFRPKRKPISLFKVFTRVICFQSTFTCYNQLLF